MSPIGLSFTHTHRGLSVVYLADEETMQGSYSIQDVVFTYDEYEICRGYLSPLSLTNEPFNNGTIATNELDATPKNINLGMRIIAKSYTFR